MSECIFFLVMIHFELFYNNFACLFLYFSSDICCFVINILQCCSSFFLSVQSMFGDFVNKATHVQLIKSKLLVKTVKPTKACHTKYILSLLYSVRMSLAQKVNAIAQRSSFVFLSLPRFTEPWGTASLLKNTASIGRISSW